MDCDPFKKWNPGSGEVLALEKCMACGSDDLCDIFDSVTVECSACEARHYPDGEKWVCADGDSVRGIQAAEANVRDAFDD